MKMKMANTLYSLLRFPSKVYNRLIGDTLKRNMLLNCGVNVRFGRNIHITWNNCSLGNDVYIGPNAQFICAKAPLTIGNHVMFGPNLTIVTGDHRTDIKGRYMSQVAEQDKLPENDQPVIIEGDNWIGANATILKGG